MSGAGKAISKGDMQAIRMIVVGIRQAKWKSVGPGQYFLFCLFTSFFGNPIPEMVVPVYEFLFVGEVELLPVLEEVRESKRHSTVVHPTTTVVSLEEIVSLANSITGFT